MPFPSPTPAMFRLFVLSVASVLAYMSTAARIMKLRSATDQHYVLVSCILAFAMGFASYQAVVLLAVSSIPGTLPIRMIHWVIMHGFFGAVYIWISWDLFRFLIGIRNASACGKGPLPLLQNGAGTASTDTRSQKLGVGVGQLCVLAGSVLLVVSLNGLKPDEQIPVSAWRMSAHLGIFCTMIIIWTGSIFALIDYKGKRADQENGQS